MKCKIYCKHIIICIDKKIIAYDDNLINGRNDLILIVDNHLLSYLFKIGDLKAILISSPILEVFTKENC